VSWTQYAARRGESLDAIARHHGLTAVQLRVANDSVRLDKRGRLRSAGPVLVPMREAAVGKPAPARVAALTVPAAAAGGTTRSVASTVPAAGRSYIVRAGDTLYAIARRFDTAVDTLLALNKLAANGAIHPGLKLRLP
jgi:peptidoglycan lytic transglycosylase D